jgi:Tn3 transposase DDE domain
MLEPQTWHILSYIDDQAFRRRVLIGLNKGETLHSMARAIFFGRQGRFMDRGYEAQLNRASALSLVLNAIVVWNTRHFDRAQEKLAQLGDPVEEQVWQHLSAILWEHINLVGSYHFSDVQIVVKVELFVSHNERTEGCAFGGPRGDQGGGLDFSYVLPLTHEVVAPAQLDVGLGNPDGHCPRALFVRSCPVTGAMAGRPSHHDALAPA